MPPKKPTLSLAMLAIRCAATLATIAVLSGCDSAERAPDQAETHAPVGQTDAAHQPLSHTEEFDRFTLQVNITRTDFLDDASAEQYDIDSDPDYAMLNLVILENRSDGGSETVSAEVTAEYDNQLGQVKTIDMRSVHADGYISYIGTLDASSQRTFNFSIDAQPADTDEPLHMDFEVELDW